MPNTLGHIGVHGPLSRIASPGADLKWVFLGAIIPDLPWILRKIVLVLPVGVSAYDIGLYAAAQSSLFLSLILCAGLAACSKFAGRVFVILALNSLLHLLLDATQTKWGNGVHLFAPLSWHLTEFNLFWPEDLPTLVITALGLAFFVYAWWRLPPPSASDLVWPRGHRAALVALALAAYALLPPAFFSAMRADDSHYVATLLERQERPGRFLELDRKPYIARPDGDRVRTWAGEDLAVVGNPLDRPATVSIRARFVDEATVEILELHVHPPGLRDLASVVGLALILAYWLRSLWPLLQAGRFGRVAAGHRSR